ncbi:alpha/beta hydrolase [Streptacidiphilus pinicola]|uniref:Alpha/beta hydrolase n=1 Tax=Streptacidiphilus pinicola TaxID=2219663 RepID=A0A2X0IHT9_9ACTN|nr:alpha/beta fold hydrolase [Streptacidiphilus pinicola]RAG84672.1 alpha/beta hydrolase [Streptacidiphilus pinicola]
MSTPPFLTLPACARSVRLRTARGEFAALHAVPQGRDATATALLVPGFTGSKEDFIALLEPLAEDGLEVVAIDQRGQYETGGPDDVAAYALEELSLDLLAVTAELRERTAARPLHLLAHSFAGYVARDAVLRATGTPLPWSSLTLLSTGPAAVGHGETERAKLLLAALPAMTLEEIWQAMQEMDEAGGAKVRLEQDIAEFLHRRWLANVPAALAAMAQRLISEPDRVDALAKVSLPKLVVSGEQDYAWPVELQAQMALRLSAEHVVVPGAGHSPNAERPAGTAVSLSAFWSNVLA